MTNREYKDFQAAHTAGEDVSEMVSSDRVVLFSDSGSAETKNKKEAYKMPFATFL